MSTTTTDFPVGQMTADSQLGAADGDTTSGLDHKCVGTQSTYVLSGSNFPVGYDAHDTHRTDADGDTTSATDQRASDTHIHRVSSGSNFPVGHGRNGTQQHGADGEPNSERRAIADSGSTPRSLASPTLALAADVLDDLERVRIADQNRLRQLTRTETDSDGEDRGFGLDSSHPDVARLEALVKMLEDAEKAAVKNLTEQLKKHPLGPWVKAQKGVGDKTAARLLAVVGDPASRSVGQLWSYCGHGDAARRPFKGMTQEEMFRLGNPTAKKRTWLIATAILKSQGPMSEVYYVRKTATEGRLHTTECKRCGPSGKPAQPGSPWSDAHRHADALRILGKHFLKELWREAARLHEELPA